MNPTQPITHYLKDYQPPEYLLHTVDLVFDIHDDHTTVTNTMQVYRPKHTLATTPLVLNGEHQTLLSVHLNDRKLTSSEYILDAESLTLKDLPAEFTLTIVSQNKPQENTALTGLYQSGDMLCTQCESHGFRRITYFLDRPDVMCLFTTKIIADATQYPNLLSNGNCIEKGVLLGGRHYATWEDPFKKPCYLFALVAGNLALREGNFVTASGRTVALHIFTRHADFDKSGYAIQALQESMAWDEKAYGREYDLDVYMIVAVGDFNMGAMENKGLNIFNTKYVLVSEKTATDTDYRQTHAVIGHEYFHNWTGNRVTCRDWFQLSLKEGLTVFRDQQFTADHYSKTVKRIEDVKIIRSAQFAEDAGPMSHPIRPESYIEMNNFYTVTVYNKGAEVIRMMHTLVGAEGFRKGMDLYFERHDGQAVTCDDYVAAIADANHIDLTQFKRWYTQAGTPVVNLQGHYDTAHKRYTLTVQQSGSFMMPIKLGFIGASGHALQVQYQGKTSHEFVCILKDPEHSFVFEHVTEAPTPSLFRDFSAPVKIHFPYSQKELAHLLSFDTNEFNRWDAGQQLAAHCILQHQNADIFIQGLRNTLENPHLDPALIAEVLTLPAESLLAQEMKVIDPEHIHQGRVTLLNTIATTLKAQLLHHYHNAPSTVGGRQLKNICLQYLARLKDSDMIKMCEQQFNTAQNMTDQLAALIALVNGHDPLARQKALDHFYTQFKEEALVMDKWLALQAGADLPCTFETVQTLTKHPIYQTSNPNKVYALIGGFSANPYHFHRADGKGYDWLADQVIALDKNPQVAARMVRALINFKRYEPTRQTLMKQALEKVIKTPSLSKDVYEIASKSLAVL